MKALNYSGIDPKEIQQMWLAHYPVQADMQTTAGQVAVDAVGLSTRVGCITIEQACCSGSQAIHDAVLSIEAGRYDCVLLVGVGKTRDSMRRQQGAGLGPYSIGPHEESGFNPFLSHAGIILEEPGGLSQYIRTYVTPEDITAWNLTEYWYATKHPNSICYGKPIPTQEELMEYGGGTVSSVDCDGAAAVILASRDFARRYTDELIYVAAVSHKEESSHYAKMMDYGYGGDAPRYMGSQIIYTHSIENAWRECFEQAKIEPIDLDFVNVHDCTMYVTYAHLEGMHHPDIPPGRAPKWFTEGQAYPTGKLPVDTSGAAKFGHPRGAIGVFYLIENYMQLKEECGQRQVPLRNYIAAAGTSPGRPAFHIERREK